MTISPITSDLRVLQVCSYYSNALYSLLFDALEDKGIRQEVYYFAARGVAATPREDYVTFSACYNQVDRLFFKIKETKVLASLHESLDVSNIRLSHAHSLFSNGYIALDLKKRQGIPYIVAVRNTDVNSFFRTRPWLRRTGIEIMREASRVVFISPAYRASVLHRFVPKGLREDISRKAVVIPNGISRVFLEEQPDAPREFDGVIRVLQVGEINRNKNQLLTAEACALLKDRGIDVRLIVIGRVNDRRVAARLADYGFVKMIEPLSQFELLEEYRTADVFAMPSKQETFGLVYAEAMSQGLPVLYTQGQGFDGLFKDGKIGYAVSPHNPQELAVRILDVYKDKESMFESCKMAARQFMWGDVATVYARIYREAVDNNA